MTRVDHALAGLTPGEWLARLRRLRQPLRRRVASIVWWDYFSQRLARDARHELDELVTMPQPFLKRWRLERGLVKVGYDPERARRRVASGGYAPVRERPAATPAAGGE